MDMSSWVMPLIIVAALGTTAAYFLGRRRNVALMKEYAASVEKEVKPVDQQYTWIGGYIGYKGDFKVKDEIVKAVKVTLHLKPRMSIMYLPVSRFTMPHDKMYVVIESKRNLPGEAHLIQKGQYRFVPAGIDHVEKFQRRDVVLGGSEFQLLYLDARGEKALLGWAESIKADDYSMIKHLSFTSSTNVVYARFEPEDRLIGTILRTGQAFTHSLVK
ncbi:MAG: hypothetical protein M0R22_03195 [Dehalococcoidia bacterium]|jgi:hypothetical protein|nr:hypothetical protein [Dehalococcoidia bacterium]